METTPKRLDYYRRMEEGRLISNTFKATPAWKPYTDGHTVHMVTFDPYTDGTFGEAEVLRWSIYYGRQPKKPNDGVRLQHDRTDGGRYYQTIEEAQTALDTRAKAGGWQIIPKDEDEDTQKAIQPPKQFSQKVDQQFLDLYTDGAGHCFSDADEGL